MVPQGSRVARVAADPAARTRLLVGSGVLQEEEAVQVSRQEETFLSSFPIGSWQSLSHQLE